MSLTISSATSSPPLTATNSSPNTEVANTQKAPPPSQPGGDTVKLSESQQVHQLFHQGQQVSQIAFNLRLTVQAVNSYLGITQTSQ